MAKAKVKPDGENDIVQRLHEELTTEARSVFSGLVQTGGPDEAIAQFASLPRKRQVELFREALQLLAVDFEPEEDFSGDDEDDEVNDEEE